ncbi:MAG: SUMF1/EgtB/PvdO family nonheme iron enzyme [Chloroflexi bacterium]|nr:SUMF1/EgtB/PvdO family nonheme iron enzyme [Chloroflexota bacterium]
MRAFGLTDELRPALAAFLYELRSHFAQIKQYEPLMQFALDLRAQKKRDETNAWLAAMAGAQGILATSDDAQALKDYLAHVREKRTYLSFLFVRPRSREATTEAELEAVFVPLQVQDPEQEEKMRRKSSDLSGLKDLTGLEREKPSTINDILPRYDCLLLKGAPGSGKTTLLRHLALAFANGDAREKLAWQGEPLLPILVPLRNFGAYLDAHRKEFPDPAPMSLLTYIQQHFGQNALAQLSAFFRDREGGKDASDTWARRFLVVAHQRSGLYVEGAPNLYNFSHSNFREYLAATELVKELDSDLVRIVLEHVGDAWWEETILLAMALKELGDPRRKLVMDELLARGHLLMAGKCAVDMSDRLPAPLRQEITDKLLAQMQALRAPIKTRASAGEALDALGWLPPDLDTFVHIPAGETTFNDERVRVPEFFVAKYPVTNYQFQKFIDAGGYENETYWRDQRGVDEKGREQNLKDEAWKWLQERGGVERRPFYWDNPRFHRAGYPVIGVTWYEASAYCKWLTEQIANGGLLMADSQWQSVNPLLLSAIRNQPSALVFRLPTELEWVRAAGGDANNRYPWQSPTPPQPSPLQGEGEGGVIARANVKESDLGGTTPVAMYPDGARVTEGGERIFDLAGNVWEWTSNTFEKSYRGAWMRGGSWAWNADPASVSSRIDLNRHSDYHNYGLRVFAQ